jgi:ribosome-binding protein aMBF1 (putative translation factor)
LTHISCSTEDKRDFMIVKKLRENRKWSQEQLAKMAKPTAAI